MRKTAENRLPWNLAVLLLMAGVTLLLYGRTFGYPWLYDDYPVIVTNPDIRSLAAFLTNNFPGRPLREFSFLLDYQFFNLEPAGYHFQNILWHLLNGFLVYRLAITIGFSKISALAASLIFLVHPMNVEVVAQTSHRKDSLAMFFGVSSLFFWRRMYCDQSRKMLWLAGTLCMGALAVLAKENAFVLPGLWLLYEYVFVPSEKRLFLKKKKVVSAVVTLSFLIVLGRILYFCLFYEGSRHEIMAAMNKMADMSSVSLGSYYLMVIKSQAFIFSKWIFPGNLAPEYTYSPPISFFDPWVLGGIVVFGVLLAGMWKGAKESPVVVFLLGWIFLFWFPVSNYLGHYAYFAADRYLYLPGAGLALLSSHGVASLPWRRISAAGFSALIITFFLLASRQVEIWRSPAAFNAHILKVNPSSLEGQIGLAMDYMEEGRNDKAISLLHGLVIQYPSAGRIYRSLALALCREGNIREAITYAEWGVRVEPSDAEGHANLGSYYDMLGEREKALSALKRAVSLTPGNERFHTNLGIIYQNLGRLDHAVESHRKSIAQLPSYGRGHFNLGVALYKQGKRPEALESFQTAHGLLPGESEVTFNLGYVAIELGHLPLAQRAIADLRRIEPARAEELEKFFLEQSAP